MDELVDSSDKKVALSLRFPAESFVRALGGFDDPEDQRVVSMMAQGWQVLREIGESTAIALNSSVVERRRLSISALKVRNLVSVNRAKKSRH
jgi:hypothetical protein